MELKELIIERITVDEDLQIRVGVNSNRVEEFVDIYSELPPWRVIKTKDDKFILADGFHRRKAAIKKGYKKAQCKVEEGDYKRALEIAIQENCKGPLNLSRQEKINTIEKTLKYFPERANSWIAEMIGVSMQTVDKVRRQLEENKTIQIYEKLETRDGRMYPRDIVEKININLDKEDSDRKESPSREDIIISLMEGNKKRSEDFNVDSKKYEKLGEKKEVLFESYESIFVDDLNLKGDVLSVSTSIDQRKAIKFMESEGNIIISIYYLKGDRFFSESSIVLLKESFEELIK